jgi:hypothetical protein
VPDELTARNNKRLRGIRHHLRIGQFDESTIVFKELIGVYRWQTLRVEQ